MLKLLVELLGSPSKDVVVSTLRLTHLLMLKYEWRVCFATEGGVKAILACMQEFLSVPHVQQLALAVRTSCARQSCGAPPEVLSDLTLLPFLLRL